MMKIFRSKYIYLHLNFCKYPAKIASLKIITASSAENTPFFLTKLFSTNINCVRLFVYESNEMQPIMSWLSFNYSLIFDSKVVASIQTQVTVQRR